MAIEVVTIKDATDVTQSITVDSTTAGKTQLVKLAFAPDGTDPVMVSATDPVPTVQTGALPAGTNNIGDIDVLTVPADPFGANADVAVAAGAAGSQSAKLRRLTTDIDAIKTSVAGATPAGTNNIGDVDVLSLPALATGANAIGKLAANSGVDIGDVDVLSIIPGTGATNLGKIEDAAHTTGDVGVMALGVRNDAGTVLAGLTGDYIPFSMDANGAIRVSGAGGGTQYVEDVAHVTGDTGTMILTVRKDTAAAPAGTTEDYQPLITNAAGKLYTVADVTGPVDLSAGEAFVGFVGGKTKVITPAITVSTVIYAANDVIGGRLTLTNAMRVTSGTGVLQDFILTTADGEALACRLLFFDSATAVSIADNAAFAWGAGDHAKLLAIVDVAAGDWITLDADGVCHKQGLGIVMEANGSQNLYCYILATATPTFTATTDLTARFKFLQD